MKITLLLSPADNVDFKVGQVVNTDKISQKEFDWEGEVTVISRNDSGLVTGEEEEKIKAHSLSLYDHFLVLGGVNHQILQFFSK